MTEEQFAHSMPIFKDSLKMHYVGVQTEEICLNSTDSARYQVSKSESK